MSIKNTILIAALSSTVIVGGLVFHSLTANRESIRSPETIKDEITPIHEMPEEAHLSTPTSISGEEKKEEIIDRETAPDVPYKHEHDLIKTDIEEETVKSEELEYKEEDEYDAAKDGPPPQGIVVPIPIFEPVASETGPVAESAAQEGGDAQPADSPEPAAPPAEETEEHNYSEETEEHNYEGPPVPPDIKTKPLPPFTPITNKTGPAN